MSQKEERTASVSKKPVESFSFPLESLPKRTCKGCGVKEDKLATIDDKLVDVDVLTGLCTECHLADFTGKQNLYCGSCRHNNNCLTCKCSEAQFKRRKRSKEDVIHHVNEVSE